MSLRDIAATIVDLLDLEDGSPLPGASLARYWDKTSAIKTMARSAAPAAMAEVVPGDARYRDVYGLPQKTWPMSALNQGAWSYIRTEGRVREELFHLGRDREEARNLAADPDAQPVLRRMRDTLDHLTGGPLSPTRFNR